MIYFNRFITALIITFFSTVTLNSQTNWYHYSENPIVQKSNPGEWDSEKIGLGMYVLFDGNEYKMWYQGKFNGVDAIGYATSKDGMKWQKYENNPVLQLGVIGSWDAVNLQMGCVILDGDTYKMYYDGNGSEGWAIGMATSPNGINWTKDTLNNPVLVTGESGNWDDRAVWSPHVIKVNAGYKMWFTANKWMNGWSDRRIGFAESTDGINWTKHSEPVLEEGNSEFYYHVESPSVTYDGVNYNMWYSRENENFYHQIDYAVSSDGISWNKHRQNPVIVSGAGDDWYRSVFHPNVIKQDDSYKMWFVGSGADWAFGYAEDFSAMVHSDSIFVENMYYAPMSDPVNIIARVCNPESHSLTVKAMLQTDEEALDSVDLSDDGLHNDGSADDGIYGGYYTLTNENNYTVSVKTTDLETGFIRSGSDWGFSERFTSRGPVVFEALEIITDDTEPNAGSRPKFNLTLHNFSNTDTIYNVDVNIIIPDSLMENGLIINSTTGIPKWGHIPPGESLTNWSRPYALTLKPECQDRLYYLGIEITSIGEAFWYDTFDITVEINDDVSGLPYKFALEQNYPNPFNPSTTIEYSIPKAVNGESMPVGMQESIVNLKIYDVLGREVATLVNKQQQPGVYKVRWDASDQASGVYFYKLTAGKFADTKKMILLR